MAQVCCFIGGSFVWDRRIGDQVRGVQRNLLEDHTRLSFDHTVTWLKIEAWADQLGKWAIIGNISGLARATFGLVSATLGCAGSALYALYTRDLTFTRDLFAFSVKHIVIGLREFVPLGNTITFLVLIRRHGEQAKGTPKPRSNWQFYSTTPVRSGANKPKEQMHFAERFRAWLEPKRVVSQPELEAAPAPIPSGEEESDGGGGAGSTTPRSPSPAGAPVPFPAQLTPPLPLPLDPEDRSINDGHSLPSAGPAASGPAVAASAERTPQQGIFQLHPMSDGQRALALDIIHNLATSKWPATLRAQAKRKTEHNLHTVHVLARAACVAVNSKGREDMHALLNRLSPFAEVPNKYLMGDPGEKTRGLTGDLLDVRGDLNLERDARALVHTLRTEGRFAITSKDEMDFVQWMQGTLPELPLKLKVYNPENRGGLFWQFLLERAADAK